MDPQPLDYRTPMKSNRVKKQEWGPVPTDRESKRWRFYRRIYYFGLFTLFGSIAVYFGPNEIMFQKLTRPSLSDFTNRAQDRYAPVVRAIKMYRRDSGRLPQRLEDLSPKYLPPRVGSSVSFIGGDDQIEFFSKFGEFVNYSLDPKSEGWSVSGPFISGQLPLPLINITPAKKP